MFAFEDYFQDKADLGMKSIKINNQGVFMKKRLVTILMAAILACGSIATPVMATNVDDLKKSKASKQSEVDALQTQLNELMTKMNDLETQLIEKGQEKTQAEADLKVAEEKEQQQYEDMKLRIKYMYEEGDNSALERIVDSGDIADVLAQTEYVEKVHTYDRNMLEEYKETVQQVKDLKSTIEEDLQNIQDLEAEYESQSEELNTTISNKSAEITNIDSMIQEAAKAALEAQKKAEAEKKAKEEAQAKAAKQAAASQTASASTATSNTSASTTTTTTDTTAADTSSSSTATPAADDGTIVGRAYSWVGNAEYVWGACSPGAFDCSGFVSYCLTGQYARLGTTYTFLTWTQVSDPQPGDVCVNANHCGIYIGGGQMIHAADYGIGVIVGAVQDGMIYVRY